jgi:hypothetical protein
MSAEDWTSPCTRTSSPRPRGWPFRERFLAKDSLAYLRYPLQTGKKILLSSIRPESIWSWVALRIKKIGRRWSRLATLRILAASLVYLLHPDRYEQLKDQIRGTAYPSSPSLFHPLNQNGSHDATNFETSPKYRSEATTILLSRVEIHTLILDGLG